MEIMHKADHFKLFGQTVIMPDGFLGHIAGKISGKPTIQIHKDFTAQSLLGLWSADRLSSIMGEEGNVVKNGSGSDTFIMANASDYRSTKRQYDMLQ